MATTKTIMKVNKLMWVAITSVLMHVMRSANISPADVKSLKEQHLDPVAKIIDSDGDGIPDDQDADPQNAAVA